MGTPASNNVVGLAATHGVPYGPGAFIVGSDWSAQQITVVGAYSHTITTSPPTTGQQAGVEASQDSYRLTTSYALTPRTRLSGGIRYQRFTSNQANDFQEKAVLAAGEGAWVWRTDQDLPELPPRASPRATGPASEGLRAQRVPEAG